MLRYVLSECGFHIVALTMSDRRAEALFPNKADLPRRELQQRFGHDGLVIYTELQQLFTRGSLKCF